MLLAGIVGPVSAYHPVTSLQLIAHESHSLLRRLTFAMKATLLITGHGILVFVPFSALVCVCWILRCYLILGVLRVESSCN